MTNFKIGDIVRLIKTVNSRYFDKKLQPYFPELTENIDGVIIEEIEKNRFQVRWKINDETYKITNVYTDSKQDSYLEFFCEIERYDIISDIEDNLNKLFSNV